MLYKLEKKKLFKMVCVLHSKEPLVLFDNMDSYFLTTPPDCSLFSQDNHEIQIHKELLYQTKFTREMINSVGLDFNIEVICPSLSKDELEIVVDFLYSGKILFSNEKAVSRLCMNLEELFGFPLIQDEMSETTQPLSRPVTRKKARKQSGDSDLLGVGYPEIAIKVEKDIDNHHDLMDVDFCDEVKCEPGDVLMKEEFMVDQESNYNPADKKFSCTFCEHSFGSRSGMRKHIQSKHSNNVKTKKTFGQKKIPEQTNRKEKSIIRCLDCEQSFPSKKLRIKHIRALHPERRIYKCPICTGKFLYLKTMTEHLSNKHPEQNSEGKQQLCDQDFESSRKTCPICKKVFNSIVGMMKHYVSAHPEGKVYDCSVCEKKYLSLNGLNAHVFKSHERKVTDLCCFFCGKEFQSKLEVKTHIFEEHKEKKFQCSKCEVSYGRQETLQRHIELVHEGKRYQCTQCGEDFESMQRLETHTIVKHDRSKLFECPTCGSVYTTKQALEKHVAFDHDKTFGNLCPECGKNFKSKKQLREHILVVHEGKKINCQFCAASFNQTSGLNSHVNIIHKGIKPPPVKCSQCEKVFNSKAAVKRHIREVHERKRPYACHLCDMTFGQSGNLKTHIKGKHRNVV